MSQALSLLKKPISAKKTWNALKNNDIYWINGWGENYFDINENGHVIVRPDRNNHFVDLYELIRSLVQRGIEPPIGNQTDHGRHALILPPHGLETQLEATHAMRIEDHGIDRCYADDHQSAAGPQE